MSNSPFFSVHYDCCFGFTLFFFFFCYSSQSAVLEKDDTESSRKFYAQRINREASNWLQLWRCLGISVFPYFFSISSSFKLSAGSFVSAIFFTMFSIISFRILVGYVNISNCNASKSAIFLYILFEKKKNNICELLILHLKKMCFFLNLWVVRFFVVLRERNLIQAKSSNLPRLVFDSY